MLHSIDICVIVFYLASVVGLGMWFGRSSRDLNDYLIGGRELPWYAVLGSIVATETSTATFLSVPGLAYVINGNLGFLQLSLGLITGRLLVLVFLLPGFMRGELFSAYQLLERQFGRRTQQFASLLFLVARNLGDGLRLFLAGVALQAVTAQSLNICIIVIGIITILYTFLGGMKSVIWNDCLQFVIYTTGGLVALVLIVKAIPGQWNGLVLFGSEHGKFHMFRFDLDLTVSYTFWSGLLGGTFLSLGTHGTDQMMVQRYLSARSRKDAAIALALSGPVVAVQFALFLVLGIALACFYEHPPAAPFGDKGDLVLAQFIVDHLPIGLTGLCLASVFAAAMSTLSSSLHSSAAALVNDFTQHDSTRLETPDCRRLGLTRMMIIGFGLLQVVIGIGAGHVTRSVVSSALAISGFTSGVLVAVFLLGLRSKPPQQASMLAGMVCGLAAVAAVHFGTTTAWTWLPLVGAFVTVSVAGLFNLAVKPVPSGDTTS